jgi:hypothetical protein
MAGNVQGKKVETPREATQAENSPDTFIILTVSLVALFIIGLGIFYYFGLLPGSMPPTPIQQ